MHVTAKLVLLATIACETWNVVQHRQALVGNIGCSGQELRDTTRSSRNHRMGMERREVPASVREEHRHAVDKNLVVRTRHEHLVFVETNVTLDATSNIESATVLATKFSRSCEEGSVIY